MRQPLRVRSGSEYDLEPADTLENEREPDSSAVVLEALEQSERAFASYQRYCVAVDAAYSPATSRAYLAEINDNEMDIFWASMEILKPAIYAKPPKPIAGPRFKDGGPVEKTTAELIERCLESVFDRGNIDEVMLGIRDDLALTNRGVAWITYETDQKGGGQRVCIEHLDRTDFLHEPARKWADVGWVARRGWMTRTEMRKRFYDQSGDAYLKADFIVRTEDRDNGSVDGSEKAGVWEVWSKVDDKVYWVSKGCDVILDEDEPHLNLTGFFPCPRPAYGTLQRRSLLPVPDFRRYDSHLAQINALTERIYVLLNQVKLKVLIPAGGEVGEAVETALTSEDDRIVIPVPAAALTGAGAGNLMVTIPLTEIATTIQGLIEARGQLIEDFYQLSGISDIMRGATEAQETLGAQQLKSQYGSVRVRDKIDELQRIARDIAEISAEIMSANFSQKTLLDLSRMTIPTRSEVDKKLKELEQSARDAIKGIHDQAAEAVQQAQGQDSQQVMQRFQEQQQAAVAQYEPLMAELGATVVIDDVMKLLKDEKTRALAIDIETDSTILTDEMAEKQSRAEFMNALSGSMGALQPLMMAGEAGAKLAGGILKFALQPYRANRELDALIDEFVDNAPAMPQGEGQDDGLAAAQMELAKAEMAKVESQTAANQANAQLKMQEIELKASEAQSRAQEGQQKFQLEIEKTQGTIAETAARIQKIEAEIQKMGVEAQIAGAKVDNDARKTDIDEFRAVSDVEARQTDQAMSAMNSERQAAQSERQMSFSERQAMQQRDAE